ncbi:ALF repeat-containing protein [Promicromonospora sp. NPDC059942]|uniref:ALF repeat-containing protein n=1 Tax=Promicromonospora sp. NPDC059942 TaxID=3347009 RepID=UPI0036520E81
MRREAQEALDVGTVEAMTYFLETGWQAAKDEDNLVAIFVILADPDTGRGVRTAAEAAIRDGSSEALVYFLETGRWIAQDEDNMVAIFVIIGDPDTSPALKAAAVAAINGTPEDRAYFLETGQYEVD